MYLVSTIKQALNLLIALVAAMASSPSLALPSASGLSEYSPISLTKYLQIVKENNAIIGNRRLDILTAAAIKQSLSLYQFNPSISYTKGTFYQRVPYTPYDIPTSNTYGLNFNIEGWDKRSARSNYGEAEIGRSDADYIATETDVQTAATLDYIDALRNRLLFDSYATAAKKVSSLPQSDETKDSALFLHYYENASAQDLQFTSLNLLNYSGDKLKNPPLPIGQLNIVPENFNLEDLIKQALASRTDILLMQAALNSSEKNISMTHANRNLDVQFFVSYTTTPEYTSSDYTYLRQSGFSAGLSIPVPVNNYLQNADIVQADNQKLGLEMQLRDLKSKVRVQIMQALLQYDSAKKILSQANDGFIELSKVTSQNISKDIMDVRDKEGALIDAQTNHLKALVNVWRQSGNYSIPKL